MCSFVNWTGVILTGRVNLLIWSQIKYSNFCFLMTGSPCNTLKRVQESRHHLQKYTPDTNTFGLVSTLWWEQLEHLALNVIKMACGPANGFSWSTYISNVIGHWNEDGRVDLIREQLPACEMKHQWYINIAWRYIDEIVFSNCVTGISLNSVNQLRLWTIKADQPETQEVCQLDWDCLFSAKAIQVDTLRSITDGRCRSSPVWMLSHETVSGHVWLWMLSWRRFIERPASQGQGQRSGGLQSMSHHALGQSGAASVSGLPLLKMW